MTESHMIVCNKPKNLSLMTLKTSQLASVSCFAAVCPGYRHEMIIFVWNFTAIETISHSEQREKRNHTLIHESKTTALQ